MTELPFENRTSAGRALAQKLEARDYPNPVVYALPRGGVPIALEIAKKIQAPLDLLLVRKIGVPNHEELAAGSIVDGEKPDIIVNPAIVHAAQMTKTEFEVASARALKEIERRRALYLADAKPIPAKGATAILVDDGIATGASMRAAIEAVRRREPARVVVAVPVASREAAAEFSELADVFICIAAPLHFGAVGYYYRDFTQLTDEDVIALMQEARAMRRPGSVVEAQ
jgi:putative phosphoribosyl transferase